MTDDVLATTKNGEYRVRVMPDLNPQNPRKEFDQLAHAITVDEQGCIPVDEDGGSLADAFTRLDRDRTGIFIRWARIFHDAVVIESQPNEGAHALWYLTGDEIKTKEITDPAAVIEAEIKEYQAWADGEIYGYKVEKRTRWVQEDDPTDTRETWENFDSCWGYDDLAYAQSEARAALARTAKEEQ